MEPRDSYRMDDEPNLYELVAGAKELMALGNARDAANLLEKATEIEPDKASIREARARALFNSGQIARAGEEFTKAIEIDPANHYAHYGLGLCRARLGDKAKAIGSIKIALAMRPDSEDYQFALRRLAR